jgi:hypothetical protein
MERAVIQMKSNLNNYSLSTEAIISNVTNSASNAFRVSAKHEEAAIPAIKEEK